MSTVLKSIFGSLNAKGIDLEELAFCISECAALIVVGVMIWGIIQAVVQ